MKSDGVIVVGGGPVGMTAALKLVRAGIPVTVLEKAPAPYAEPRASTFHPPTLDMLKTVGLGDALVDRGRPAPQWQYKWFESGENAVMDMGVLSDLTEYPFRLQCEQLNLVELAAERIQAEAPGSLVFSAEATGVRQDTDGAEVTATIGGETKTFRGRWVIGTDGASSVIRTGLGLSFEGDTYPLASVTVGTTVDIGAIVPGLLGVNYFWSEFGSFGMFQTKKLWRVGWSPPPEMPDAEATNEANVQEKLHRICPYPNKFPVPMARVYRIHRRVVDTLRVGRVLLAGDAAHLNSPMGGFGMNGGVHDAFNLTDKLIAVYGGADPSLLDVYSRQRRSAAVADIQITSDANYRRLREKDPAKRRDSLKQMQAIAADRAKMRAFLLENTLISSLQRAAQVA